MDFKNSKDESPEEGKRVCVKLPDGRMCSGMVGHNNFDLDRISSEDYLAAFLKGEVLWSYIDE